MIAHSQQEPDWVALLQTAKTIRRSVRPVGPSPRFRDHLRSDLSSRLSGDRQARSLTISDGGRLSPLLVFTLCLGLFAAGMAFRLARGGGANPRS